MDKRLDGKVKCILKIYDVKTWIRHSKNIIVYDMEIFFFKNHADKAGELVPDHLLFFVKAL